MAEALCSCDTKKPFSECCEPVLNRAKAPGTAADLMRARYTAFARQHVDFIMDSVSPARQKEMDRKSIEAWSRGTQWEGLEIVATEKGGPEDETGKVEFKAKFREDGEIKEHHELATFVKLKGAWFFDDGRTPPGKPVKSEGPKTGRNDPCPCGSGKKYKKCHGAG
ncbi:MAG TPA: YchJ family protein [Fibrobacteria bacterium]|nr:YchJ family protein [Fibrobacteria bacterium]